MRICKTWPAKTILFLSYFTRRVSKEEFQIFFYIEVFFSPFYVEKTATFFVIHVYTLSKQSVQRS